MPDLRKTSIALGTTPASLPTISNPRPAAPKVDAPRDSGGMADGSTGGNFRPVAVPGAIGADAQAAGVDQAQTAFEANGK